MLERFRQYLLIDADFDRAYAALSGESHFFAETLRGRVRMLQFNLEQAWAHFDRAVDLSRAADDTLENLGRIVALHSFRILCALREGSLARDGVEPLLESFHSGDGADSEDGADAEEEAVSEDGADAEEETHLEDEARAVPILGKHRDDRFLLAVDIFRRLTESKLLLYLERPSEAEAQMRVTLKLSERLQRLTGGTKSADVGALCTLAAARYNLGDDAGARVQLENAGLALAYAQPEPLMKIQDASLLAAFHEFFGEHDAADSWIAYSEAVPAPAQTKSLMRRYSELILERSMARENLLVF
jgi:hypothetical protein